MPFFCEKKMVKDEIEIIVEPVIERHECFLWGIEILRGKKRPTLRIYIESLEGATIDDCENVSRDLNYEIDLDSPLGEDYVLEVSTPGIERRFFKQDQLLEYLGEDLKIKLREPLEGVKNINGTLVDCNENFFLLESDKLEYKLDFSDIDVCRLDPNFDKLMKESGYAK
jgi:ribosome maturation factor RimP